MRFSPFWRRGCRRVSGAEVRTVQFGERRVPTQRTITATPATCAVEGSISIQLTGRSNTRFSGGPPEWRGSADEKRRDNSGGGACQMTASRESLEGSAPGSRLTEIGSSSDHPSTRDCCLVVRPDRHVVPYGRHNLDGTPCAQFARSVCSPCALTSVGRAAARSS